MTDLKTDDFLSHYGVAGMKWGKRQRELRSDRSQAVAKAKAKRFSGGNDVDYKAARKDINRAYKTEMKKAKEDYQVEYGHELIEKSGGSISRAGWNAVGKGVGKQILATLGEVAASEIANRTGHPLAVEYIRNASLGLRGTLLYMDINKGISINKAKNS